MGHVITPVEIVIDSLVLRGVSESDASALVTSFTHHLERLLGAAGTGSGDPAAHLHGASADGQRLAASVARAIEQVRRT